MSKDDALAERLQQFTQQNHWHLTAVTTATAVVTILERHPYNPYTGLFWDLATTTLDTTIATMTLIRPHFSGPLIVFSPRITDRERRKLYRAKVDDVIATATPTAVLRPLIEQRCWLYHRQPAPAQEAAIPTPSPSQPIITIGNWQFDSDRVRVTKQGHPVRLTRKEFQLLTYLINHRGQVLSREQLLTGVWGYDILGSSRIVDIHISHLRDKLEDDSQHPVHLQTVRGFGYRLE